MINHYLIHLFIYFTPVFYNVSDMCKVIVEFPNTHPKKQMFINQMDSGILPVHGLGLVMFFAMVTGLSLGTRC